MCTFPVDPSLLVQSSSTTSPPQQSRGGRRFDVLESSPQLCLTVCLSVSLPACLPGRLSISLPIQSTYGLFSLAECNAAMSIITLTLALKGQNVPLAIPGWLTVLDGAPLIVKSEREEIQLAYYSDRSPKFWQHGLH